MEQQYGKSISKRCFSLTEEINPPSDDHLFLLWKRRKMFSRTKLELTYISVKAIQPWYNQCAHPTPKLSSNISLINDILKYLQEQKSSDQNSTCTYSSRPSPSCWSRPKRDWRHPERSCCISVAPSDQSPRWDQVLVFSSALPNGAACEFASGDYARTSEARGAEEGSRYLHPLSAEPPHFSCSSWPAINTATLTKEPCPQLHVWHYTGLGTRITHGLMPSDLWTQQN